MITKRLLRLPNSIFQNWIDIVRKEGATDEQINEIIEYYNNACTVVWCSDISIKRMILTTLPEHMTCVMNHTRAIRREYIDEFMDCMKMFYMGIKQQEIENKLIELENDFAKT